MNPLVHEKTISSLPENYKKSQQSEERYRLLVNSIRDYAIFLLDPNGIIQTWNWGAENLKGYKPEEVIGQSFKKFYTLPDIERCHPEHELKIAKEVGRYEEEGWRVRKDGSTFWAHIVITRLTDETGQHVGFGKITRDLTERRKAEEALRESEERFRLIVESVKDYAIITLDPAGYITSWNEGARRLKGYEADEILGSHFSRFYDPEEISTGKCEYELNEAKATGRFEDEGWRVRKDGTKFWANVILTALHDSKGVLRGFAKITRDVTERKRAEDKLRMAHESLERRVQERTLELQKAIEARDEFLSIASHELRTPLTAMSLQQALFNWEIDSNKAGAIPAEQLKDVASMMGRQIQQLTRLTDDMLDVSRIESGRLKFEMSETSISHLVRQTFASFEPLFQSSNVHAQLEVEKEFKVRADSQRMEQVISNLLSNALKYGAGSPIDVIVRGGKDSSVEVLVRDKGPGIAQKDQERIFRRFERAASTSEASGLGLGLYICQQIIEAHGGHLKVESSPGQGATFKITLPLAPA